MNINTIRELVIISNELDSKGLTKESDYLDRLIKAAAMGPAPVSSVESVTFLFESGESTIPDDIMSNPQYTGQGHEAATVMQAISNGMQMNSPKGFIQIEVGTSAPGGTQENKSVLDARVRTALDMLLRLDLGATPAPGGAAREVSLSRTGPAIQHASGSGPAAISVKHTTESLTNKAITSYSMSDSGKGDRVGSLSTKDLPPDHPYWKTFQYVRISVNAVEPPDADKGATLMRREIDELMPNYLEVPGTEVVTLDSEILRILKEVAPDAESFRKFDEKFRGQTGRSFHDAACKPLISIPSFWIFSGMNLGHEIGENVAGINEHLASIGIGPIVC